MLRLDLLDPNDWEWLDSVNGPVSFLNQDGERRTYGPSESWIYTPDQFAGLFGDDGEYYTAPAYDGNSRWRGTSKQRSEGAI